MKAKLLGLVAVGALSCGAANAVTLANVLIANTADNVGLITTLVSGPLANVTGTAYIYATSVDLSAASVTGINTRLGFEALIANDPGSIRSVAFTNGAVTSNVSNDLGVAGNKTYVWMNSADESIFGLYQGPNVPSVGSVTLNSATMTEDLIGTSTYTATGTSGFQLVPEPSAALLGAIGALALLRRRRN